MSNLSGLLARYEADARVQQLKAAVASRARVQVRGCKGGVNGFLIAALSTQLEVHQIVVANDKEEAAYLQNTLANLLASRSVRFFPDSFKRPQYFEALDTHQVLQRTEAVNSLTQTASGGEILVTYPEALFEMVVSPEVLNENRILIKQGENVDVPTIIAILTEYGFSREDFVYEPGQYSIRGGIIDIFSYGNDFPYRIELFDEEVETIRTFNPMDQLSVQRIASVSIVPNINTRFQQKDKVALLDMLPADACIWMTDLNLLMDRIGECGRKAATVMQKMTILDEGDLAELFRDKAFVDEKRILAGLQDRPLVFLNDYDQPLAVQQTLQIQTSLQPVFNKQFDLLINDLTDHSSKGYDNFIFTDNAKQIDRFYAIFNDLNAHIQFRPVLSAIHEGFIDHDLKVVCYTDHQVFERFHRYKLKRGFTKDQAINLKMLRELVPSDFVVHIDHGIGRFSGLEKIEVNGKVQESVRIVYKNNDLLYVGINSLHKLSRYSGATARRLY
ncbi:MAG: CarD family transcriptional regulator [Saprospiraceae bacterium]